MHRAVRSPIEVDRALLQGRLEEIPSVELVSSATPVLEMPRLRDALGDGPRLLVKRDGPLTREAVSEVPSGSRSLFNTPAATPMLSCFSSSTLYVSF